MEGFEPLAPPSRYLSRFRACSWIGPQKGLELALRSFLPTSHAVVTSCLLQIGRPVDPLHPRIELARSPCDIGGLLAQVPDVERAQVLELGPGGPDESGMLQRARRRIGGSLE